MELFIDKLNEPNPNIEEITEMVNQNPEYVNESGTTPLMLACFKRLENVALAIINTGHSNPEKVNNNGNTALIIACSQGLQNVALALIETGHSNSEQVNKDDATTALMYACGNGLQNVALALIKTGKSNPEHVNNDGNTALMFACILKLERVALALIETGQSNSEQVNNDGNTALILACMVKLVNVAVALIKTGRSNPEQVNKIGVSAFAIATYYNLFDIIRVFPEQTYEDINDNIRKLVQNLNSCLMMYFNENATMKKYFKRGEFTACCNEDELKIIRDCYNIFREYDMESDTNIVLNAIIVFYYSTQVLEYNAVDDTQISCINIYQYQPKTRKKMKDIIAYITKSEDIHASKIRKKILGMNPEPFKGGKNRKISRKKIMKKTNKGKNKKGKTRKARKTRL